MARTRTGWIGIDVAKATLDCAEADTGLWFQVPNTPDGWQALVERYATDPPTGVVMEATGNLHLGLHLHLAAAGWHSSVVNPSWTADYAGSRGRLTKTDRVDARLLARYGTKETPPSSAVLSAAQQRVVALMRRRAQVVKLRVMNTNQATSARSDEIIASCDAITAALETEITALDATIAAALKDDPELAVTSARLQTMTGVGPVVSTCLLGVLPELGQRDRRKLAALAGVSPHHQESGTRKKRGRIRGGRKEVTRMLFLAARVAIRHDAYFRAYFDRYMARPGKAYKMGVIAVAHKMLMLLSVMVRDGLTWPETEAYQAAQRTTTTTQP